VPRQMATVGRAGSVKSLLSLFPRRSKHQRQEISNFPGEPISKLTVPNPNPNISKHEQGSVPAAPNFTHKLGN
jgi:hypothetical protein